MKSNKLSFFAFSSVHSIQFILPLVFSKGINYLATACLLIVMSFNGFLLMGGGERKKILEKAINPLYSHYPNAVTEWLRR